MTPSQESTDANNYDKSVQIDFGTDKAIECAVSIKNLCKTYKNGAPILQNFCMNCSKGTIYGLLGSSGCGKTTAISCIVGLTKWESGEIRVFGKKLDPGSSGITGRNVGYMPQDLSLYGQLSIKEVVQFYGRIYGMSSKELNERQKFLNMLLELPTKFQRICDLSGGQKRRASLALALIHSPQLLILDEPTVGLDPLLRIRIWNYLFQLVNTSEITIIITTHYTEEVRNSHKIGVIRQGHLIFEDQPSKLLNLYNCYLLEQAVFHLCKDDDKRHKNALPNSGNTKITFRTKWKTETNFSHDTPDLVNCMAVKSVNVDNEMRPAIETNNNSVNCNSIPTHIRSNGFWGNLTRIYGLSTVLILNTTRSPLFLALALVFLAIQGALTILVLGTRPRNLPFGIVNHELSNWTKECSLPQYSTDSCHLTAISCQYLNAIQNDDLFDLISYDNENDALAQVKLGRSWGYLNISTNYSQHAYDFALEKRFASNDSVEGSRVFVNLDHSAYIAKFFILKHLYSLYLEYIQKVLESCGANGNELSVPLNFRQPVYGDEEDSFTDFVLPGAITCTILSTVCGMTAVIFISDRKQGTFSRARVAGITLLDILVGYMINLGLIVFFQLLILGAVLYFAFGFVFHGSAFLCLLLCMLTALFAVLFGIFMGTVCRNEADALIICSYIATALIMYGGVFWPLESMSAFWQHFANFVPVALPGQSLRSIIIRGLGFAHSSVWWGFASLAIWCVVMTGLSGLGYRKLCT